MNALMHIAKSAITLFYAFFKKKQLLYNLCLKFEFRNFVRNIGIF